MFNRLIHNITCYNSFFKIIIIIMMVLYVWWINIFFYIIIKNHERPWTCVIKYDLMLNYIVSYQEYRTLTISIEYLFKISSWYWNILLKSKEINLRYYLFIQSNTKITLSLLFYITLHTHTTTQVSTRHFLHVTECHSQYNFAKNFLLLFHEAR